jgi:hypothetical protein
VTDAQYLQVIGVRERYTKRMRGILARASAAVAEASKLDAEYQKELAALEIDALQEEAPEMATYATIHPMLGKAGWGDAAGITFKDMTERLQDAEYACQETENLTVGTTRFVPSGASQQAALERGEKETDYCTPAGSWVIDVAFEAIIKAKDTLSKSIYDYDNDRAAAGDAARDAAKDAALAAAKTAEDAAGLFDTDEAAVLEAADVAYEAVTEAAFNAGTAAFDAASGGTLKAAYDALVTAFNAPSGGVFQGECDAAVAAFDAASGRGLLAACEAAVDAFDAAAFAAGRILY